MKILLGLLLSLSFVFANEKLNSLYDNVILKNSKQTIVDIQNLTNIIKSGENEKAKDYFTPLVQSWKSVEAFYILGDLNYDYIDIPRFIDKYRQGNEDIKVQLDLVIASDEELKTALFKNSHKTINALEYILFTQDLNDERVKNIALIITKTMKRNLQEILNGYIEVRESFVSDKVKANFAIVNSLIESSFKLKEWRIGDSIGLSKKARGKPDNRRAEYYISKHSTIAIEAIIDTHLDILDKREFKNFGSLAEVYKMEDEIARAVNYLNSAKKYASKIENDDFSSAKNLHNSVKNLHFVYYISLIEKLNVTSKILDADGD